MTTTANSIRNVPVHIYYMGAIHIKDSHAYHPINQYGNNLPQKAFAHWGEHWMDDADHQPLSTHFTATNPPILGAEYPEVYNEIDLPGSDNDNRQV